MKMVDREQIKLNARDEFWICGIILAVAVLAYHILYFNNVLPVSEGWGIYYVELLKRGQVPYRDFAYYLPPINLLIEWIFWKLSFGYMLVFRGLYLLQRLVIVLLLYKFLSKWIQPRFSWIACLTGACLGSATVYDLCGDYNQTQTLLVVLLVYLVCGFLERDKSKSGVHQYKYIFFSGILLSLMLLSKQNLGAAAIIMCFLFLVVYCVMLRDKKFGWYCVAAVAGAAIPLLLAVILLAAFGALGPFLKQYFSAAASKAGVGAILFSIFHIVEIDSLRLFLISVLFFLTLQRALSDKDKSHRQVALLAASVFAVSFYIRDKSQIIAAWNTILSFKSLWILAIFILVLSIFLFWCSRKPSLQILVEWNYTVPVIFLFCFMLACVMKNSGNAFSEFFNRTSFYSEIGPIWGYFARYTVFIAIVFCFISGKGKNNILYPVVLAMSLGCVVDIYAGLMASSGDFVHREMFTTVPIFIALLFSLRLPKGDAIKNYIICLTCVFLCTLCMLQKYTGAYSWWGSGDGSGSVWCLPDRSESINIEMLTGFKVQETKKQEYEEITRIITENGDADSTVWGFPYVKIFNILTDHYDVSDPVPVLFYDVCSDEMAERELVWLQESSPDFVIWCDIPSCMEAHEEIYRNGARLGQRDIVDWFIEKKDSEYILVGQVENLFVYQLRDSLPVNYTYIQNPDAKNISAGEVR